MMKKQYLFLKYSMIVILSLGLCVLPTEAARKISRKSEVLGPQGNIRTNPYLFNGYSRKHMDKSRTGTPHGYSILNTGSATADTMKIIALRVEFTIDSSSLTTGNGLFGIYQKFAGTREDKEEYEYYENGNYVYDNLPHDSIYFAQHMEFVKNYFLKISNGKQYIDYKIFPSSEYGDKGDLAAYQVPEKMTKYSPGAKKKKVPTATLR